MVGTPSFTTDSEGVVSIDLDPGEYIQTDIDLAVYENFTFMTWFKTDNPAAQQMLLWSGDTSQNGWGVGGGRIRCDRPRVA